MKRPNRFRFHPSCELLERRELLSANLDFSGGGTGTLLYSGNGTIGDAPLVASGIGMAFVTGINSPANSGSTNRLNFSGAELDFTTGTFAGVGTSPFGGSDWLFAGGGSITITGTAPSIGINTPTTLLSGTFSTVPGQQSFVADISGTLYASFSPIINTISPTVAAYFGWGGASAWSGAVSPLDFNLSVPVAPPSGFSSSAIDSVDVTSTPTAFTPVSLNGYDYLVPNTTTPGSLTTSTTGVPIPGTTVVLTGTDILGNTVNSTTTTDNTGYYNFPNLNPSNSAGYTVTETPPPQYSHVGQTSTTAGANTNTPSGTPSVVSNIVLNSSDSPSTDNFFETATVSVCGYDYLVPNSVTAGDLTTSTTGTPIPGTTVTLTGTDEFGNTVNQTKTTDVNGYYCFMGLNPSSSGYTVTETPPASDTHVGQTSTTAGANTNTPPGTPSVVSTIVLTTNGATSTDNFFETVPSTPGIQIVKTASKTVLLPFQPVTYTYAVSNTGGLPLSNVVVTDDNGTPGNPADDFSPTPVLGNGTTSADSSHNIGDVNNDGKLDPSEAWYYTATVIPAVTECQKINNTMTTIGTLIVQYVDPTTGHVDVNPANFANDNIQVQFLQSQSIVDNRYGTGATAATGWSGGHKFSDLTGSDQADFQFTDSKGNVVLDFLTDYINQATKSPAFPAPYGTINYPSGYGTLGVSGGDGKMITGSATNVLFANTTITSDLINYPTGYLTNSPAETSPGSNVSTVAPSWNYTDGYTVVVSKAAFGANGFGGVNIPYVHDSPSKVAGIIKFTPMPCDSTVTNIATVTGTAVTPSGNQTVTDTDTATVNIATALGSIGDFVWQDTNKNGLQDAGEPGVPHVPVTLLDGNGNVLATTTTDANGKYLFDDLLAGSYQVQFGLPAGDSYTGYLVGNNTAIDSNANPANNGKSAVFTLSAGANDLTWDAGLIAPPVPGPQIDKEANVTTAAPFQPVTYSYTVTNTGAVPLTNVTVVDDNGTPGYTADDFNPSPVLGDGSTSADNSHNIGDLNNDGKLDPGEVWKYTATVIPPVTMFASINSSTTQVGTLIAQILPAGDVQVTYLQSQSLNDNRYGTGATSATGWTNGHKFTDLTGSDEADLRFTDGKGNTVLDFQTDYLSQATKATFPISSYVPTGVVNYPAGYGTLGATGGDGKMITGSSANVLFAGTTITTDLNQSPAFYGFTTNSPTETAPLSNISTPAGWNYTDGYTVIVSKAAFGANGFGGVTVVGVHNSPSKLGVNLVSPVPGNSTVTNTGVVTAYAGTTQLTASDTAQVSIVVSSSGSGVTAGSPTTATNQLTIPLTNKGSSAVYLTGLSITWPQGDGALQTVTLGGKVVVNPGPAGIAWTSSGYSTSTLQGTNGDRTINAGATSNLVFKFHNNVASSGYTITLNFSDGSTLKITV